MKSLIVILTLTLAGCGFGPLVTEVELAETVASADARMDAGGQWIIDAILNLLRQIFPERTAEIPALVLDKPAPTVTAVHDDGFDWETPLQVLLTALLGTGGALGYRALDHRKREREGKRVS